MLKTRKGHRAMLRGTPGMTTVTLRRRKGGQTRTAHSRVGSDCQAYSRKEGLVEIIRVNIPEGLDNAVMKAKEEFRRARRDGRLKKTAEPGRVTTLAFSRPAVLAFSGEPTGEGPGFEKVSGAVPEAPSRAFTMLPARGVLTCPECGRAGVLNGSGLSYCENPDCPEEKAAAAAVARASRTLTREDAVEAALQDLGDRMESARKGLEELARLLLKA